MSGPTGYIEPDHAGAERMNDEFEAAPTREAKFEVIKRYMGEDQAYQSLGLLLGDHSGDIADLAEGRARAAG